MSFAEPVVLVALLTIPLLVTAYARVHRRRLNRAAAFVTPALTASVAPLGPGWRRHAPLVAFAAALAVLIGAAAGPQRSLARPVSAGAVMLADDVSSSMQASDVAPSRERAAQRAGARFIAGVPPTVEVGVLDFARSTTVLQSPTANHALARDALSRPLRFGGGTAIGQAILTAVNAVRSVPTVDGKRQPGAVVLISDGASNVGVGPLAAARRAAALHIPVYTVSVGTPSGAIRVTRRAGTQTVPVPVLRRQLAEIARVSGGRSFRASDSSGVSAAYARLATRLGHRRVTQQIAEDFAGAGLVLLLLGSGMSLRWFGRLV
jgi:Ca-activated chloride channel family protein